MRKTSGFTLIEVLLSVALIGMLAGLSLPVYASFQTRNELAITTTTTTEMIRRAQQYSRSGLTDGQWGVAIQSNTATLFKGTSYATRDTTQDETSSIPTGMVAGGLGEVVFSKLSGLPTATGSMTLTSSTGDVRTITINAKGMVSN
jgi:prepilin-type N-terminal cleavage/methylation domain-containing protein